MPHAPQPMIGAVDRIDAAGIFGWACNLDQPAVPVVLDLVIDAQPAYRLIARRERRDLSHIGDLRGLCGFQFPWPARLDRGRWHSMVIRRTEDGASLPGSPVLIAPIPTVAALAPVIEAFCVEQGRGNDVAMLDRLILMMLQSLDQLLSVDAAGRDMTSRRNRLSHQPDLLTIRSDHGASAWA